MSQRRLVAQGCALLPVGGRQICQLHRKGAKNVPSMWDALGTRVMHRDGTGLHVPHPVSMLPFSVYCPVYLSI